MKPQVDQKNPLTLPVPINLNLYFNIDFLNARDGKD